MTRSLIPILCLAFHLAACDTDDDKPGAHTGDTGTSPAATDADGDGYFADEDCNDNDASIHPGATELCDGMDNDCDGEIDEEVLTTYYADADGDGFGDPDTWVEACEKPTGYVPNGTDCDDDLATAFPGNTEVCDDVDNDCDGEVDEDTTGIWWADSDGDGYGDPDGEVTACEQPEGTVDNDEDCDDTEADSFPGNKEVCDEIDNDCDGVVDEGVTTTYYADVDGDSYGDAAATSEACSTPTGYVDNALDCDDAEALVNPGMDETCNGIDDDCDGEVDEGSAIDASVWYQDYDGDTYGNAAVSVTECYQPSGYVADDTDCDDTRAESFPGAPEFCNGYDDD